MLSQLLLVNGLKYGVAMDVEGIDSKFHINPNGAIMNYKAYWLNITGTVVPVQSIHIMEVIKSPETFNYTRKIIEEIYTNHNEPMGHEGKAREEIMADLIKNHGWIRLRYKITEDRWVVELHTLSDEICLQLKEFFNRPGVVGKRIFSDIRITELFKNGGMKSHNILLNKLSQYEPDTDINHDTISNNN